jgi:hypothetical protein
MRDPNGSRDTSRTESVEEIRVDDDEERTPPTMVPGVPPPPGWKSPPRTRPRQLFVDPVDPTMATEDSPSQPQTPVSEVSPHTREMIEGWAREMRERDEKRDRELREMRERDDLKDQEREKERQRELQALRQHQERMGAAMSRELQGVLTHLRAQATSTSTRGGSPIPMAGGGGCLDYGTSVPWPDDGTLAVLAAPSTPSVDPRRLSVGTALDPGHGAFSISFQVRLDLDPQPADHAGVPPRGGWPRAGPRGGPKVNGSTVWRVPGSWRTSDDLLNDLWGDQPECWDPGLSARVEGPRSSPKEGGLGPGRRHVPRGGPRRSRGYAGGECLGVGL